MTFNHIPFPANKIRSHSPAHHPGFLALSSEMNRLSKNKLARVDWEKMFTLCHRIFQQEGCDPWTGVWFCYISAKQQGWAGLAFAVEQLISTLNHLPSTNTANKNAALIWLAQHIGDVLYSLPDAPGNRISMQRTEKGLKHLTMLATDREASSTLTVMVSYISHKATESKHEYFPPVSRPAYAMVDMPAIQPIEVQERMPESQSVDVSAGKQSRKIVLRYCVVFSLFALLFLLIGHHYFTKQQPQLMQLFQEIETLEKKASAIRSQQIKYDHANSELIKEMLERTRQNKPEWLLALPVLQDLAVSNAIENDKPPVKLASWQQLQHQLDDLEKRLLASEKGLQKHLTISEIKTEVYEIRKKILALGTPLEVISESVHSNDIYSESDRDFFDNKVRILLSEHYRF